ncbi:hypothetical protein HJP15_12285 [Pseudoalteromonas sp. NEC-BIFX-2020_002]|uniref:hypothetical protein n=1 Tax=Pseudoalteromonas sp. NEC-BIFX-2020_002 TaxID=2732353 RepID=UPI0014771E51|nr:hypothetical protein [Pseudoalteromonas sp. NEC-BIFX-2020_002]NNG43687.1 hypothetical protein [Pseudoalteromonas sp. NEC-BIFX-2020_002]
MKDSLSHYISNNVKNMLVFAHNDNYKLKNTGRWPQKTTKQWLMFFVINTLVAIGFGLFGIDFVPNKYPTYSSPQVIQAIVLNLLLINTIRFVIWVNHSTKNATDLTVDKYTGCVEPIESTKPVKVTLKVFPTKSTQFKIFTGAVIEYQNNKKQYFNRLSILQLPEFIDWLKEKHDVSIEFKTSLITKFPLYFLLLIIFCLMILLFFI